jgi:hypothetical protein
VTETSESSLPVNSFRISALAALKVLWPETYSANSGVTNVAG